MKSTLNWRQWVLYLLFVIGLMAVMLIFGDDEPPMAQWIEVRIYFAAIATACFYPLCKLTKKWEREGKIKIEEPK